MADGDEELNTAALEAGAELSRKATECGLPDGFAWEGPGERFLGFLCLMLACLRIPRTPPRAGERPTLPSTEP